MKSSWRSESEKQRDFYQMLAWIGYNCAALSGVAINDPRKFPSFEEAFPTLFEKKEQQDWRVIKERVEKFAKRKRDTQQYGVNHAQSQ